MNNPKDSPKKPERWNLVSEKNMCETRVFTILEKQMYRGKKSNQASFFTIDAPDWVNVLAFRQDGKLILVEQYRHGTDELSLEIPGGVVDAKHEHPLEAAQQELAEETGYESEKWTPMGFVTPNPALFNNKCHLFLAEDCVKTTEQDLDEHESITVHLMPFSEFMHQIQEGNIHHSLVVSALSKYLCMKWPHLKRFNPTEK